MWEKNLQMTSYLKLGLSQLMIFFLISAYILMGLSYPVFGANCCQCLCENGEWASSPQEFSNADECADYCYDQYFSHGDVCDCESSQPTHNSAFYATYDYQECSPCVDPTVVELQRFECQAITLGIEVSWETVSEIDNAGFHIHRSETETAGYNRITDKLISAEGSPTQGASYQFVDRNVEPGKTYYYKLEDVDTSGSRSYFGPVSAAVPAAIPTMTETGLIILGLAFLSVTILSLKRRRKASQYGC